MPLPAVEYIVLPQLRMGQTPESEQGASKQMLATYKGKGDFA
ncbi:hypothetical protein [Lacipirellula limnantheis]|nr:hypothetical protein [Lacipirellula limnantheis]